MTHPKEEQALQERCWLLPEVQNMVRQQEKTAATHAGLWLDKYLVVPSNQAGQSKVLQKVISARRNQVLLDQTRTRWMTALNDLGASHWVGQTITSLTLHLSRANALENAGPCLHPIYGFAYIPGSGLKGLARSWAETMWFPSQPHDNQPSACRQIERIFGWAPGHDLVADSEGNSRRKPWLQDCPAANTSAPKAQAGTVVFHDAWPIKWPRLILDIVNIHHSKYYGEGQDGDGNGAEFPPGDWESPTMANFLAIEAGTEFIFALSRRPTAADLAEEDDVRLAQEWLQSAMRHLGLGAKTNAGYGIVTPKEGAPPSFPHHPGVSRFPTEGTEDLELVTPAFLAGAMQKDADCDLRPATLRGLLRWWWRTMHAGHLSIPDLRRLEAAIWGSSKVGGAVRLEVIPVTETSPLKYEYKSGQGLYFPFKNTHGLENRPNQKTTQGVFYLSYGMDDGSNPSSRYYLDARSNIQPKGHIWSLVIKALPAQLNGIEIPHEKVLLEAKGALGLLCRFGGIGSKSRRGFGSLKDMEWFDLESSKRNAASLRKRLQLPILEEPIREYSNLDGCLIMSDIQTPWNDPWYVLDRLGFAYQKYTQECKHNPDKEALGLPRKINGPKDKGPIKDNQDPSEWIKPSWLGEKHKYLGDRDVKNMRHASPVHFHIANAPYGVGLVIRMIAFPSSILPDYETSWTIISELHQCLYDFLIKEVKPKESEITTEPEPNNINTTALKHSKPGKRYLEKGDKVDVLIIEDPKKRNRLWAFYEPTNENGPIFNHKDLSKLPDIGETVSVEVRTTSINRKQIDFIMLY